MVRRGGGAQGVHDKCTPQRRPFRDLDVLRVLAHVGHTAGVPCSRAGHGGRGGHGRATAGGGGQGRGLEEGRPVGSSFWHGGQNAWEEGWEAPTSKKAQGKALIVELPPTETDKELVWHPQWEEYAVEEVRQGQDAATSVVVRGAADLLMQDQLEGLGGAS